MTVLPGAFASSRTATSAVIALGLTGSPRSSTTKQRSASPSKASPMSAPSATTAFCRSTRFAGSSGLASWLGKVPSSSKYIGTTSQRQPAEHLGHGVAGHPVAGVDDDAQRPRRRQVDQAAQVGGVVGEHVALLDGAGDGAGRRRRNALLDGLADRGQPGVGADRGRARPAELDPVVLRGVVAGGEHGAGHVEGAGGEVEHVRAGQPDVDDVEAVRGDAVGEGRRQLGRRRAHVVADHDDAGLRRLRAQQPGQRRADLADQARVDLLADDAADVVRLDQARQVVAWNGGSGGGTGVRHGNRP